MQQVISDESIAIDPASKALKTLITVLAVAMSLYHMYVAGFGPPEAVIFRGTHLMFALALVFLLYPSSPAGGVAARSYDMLLLAMGIAAMAHIFID